MNKICSKCGSHKPATLDFFYKHKEGHGGLSPSCKECIKARVRAYAAGNVEKKRSSDKIYRQKNRDKLIEFQRLYRRDNWPAVYAATKKWKDENIVRVRELRRVHEGKRRALKAGTASSNRINVDSIRAAQKNKCAYCKCTLHKNSHLDHIIPLALGGEHSQKNLQWLCEPCNLSKGSKDPIAFARTRGRLI